MCEIGDLEQCSVWEHHTRTARKAYRCSTCGGDIALGDRYVAHFSVLDRDPTYEKQCLSCRDLAQAFASAHGGMEATPGYLPDLIEECIAEEERFSGDAQRWITARDQMAERRQQARNRETR